MSIFTGGTFSGLERAASGLRAAQAAFEVHQQNVSNANTPGYSRQQIRLQASNPYPPAGQTHPFAPGQFGTGVEVIAVERTRVAWLDAQARVANSSLGANEQATDLLQQAENLFDDPGSVSDISANNPGDFGLRKLMSNYFNAWQEVGNFPESVAHRQVLIDRADEMSTKFRDMFKGLEDVRNNADTLVGDRVAKANSSFQLISDLNCEIRRALSAGDNPNDLLDQRDFAVGELSKIININTRPGNDGSVLVYSEGTLLVQDDRVVETLRTAPDPLNDNHLKVVYARSGLDADFRDGEIAGIIHTRDVTIKNYQNQLDRLAGQMITQTNTLHNGDFNQNGAPGGDFFNPPGAFAARDMSVRVTQPFEVAASNTFVGTPGDGSAAFDHGALAYNPIAALNNQSATDFYGAILSGVGSDTQTVERNMKRYQASLLQIDTQQQSISGVNLDEEFLSITKFQRAFEAASRATSNFDDMLNQVINRMGRVGL